MGRVPALLLLLSAAAVAETSDWHGTFEAALAEAKRKDRPILAYVYDDY